MTISEGLYATLLLYWKVVVFVYFLISLSALLSYLIVYVLFDDQKEEQAYLDTYKGE